MPSAVLNGVTSMMTAVMAVQVFFLRIIPMKLLIDKVILASQLAPVEQRGWIIRTRSNGHQAATSQPTTYQAVTTRHSTFKAVANRPTTFKAIHSRRTRGSFIRV